ncbi:gliding motility-associated C-terminal domain-containing protein [Fulvivirga sp. 29W222]|uniref:Gliding motility-associated C-terminal domain-containing protein n=1 Tax=Fulvivirga marina TaxID=2494733 RepID=A0A937FWF4_9BACT|nr:gliding motility-associated C-terminal domain-containing protein [Fulvivirga marina]MBL6445581.1 gliding motility-associated C-terminal domain-containing protein [Fulvivirga marina]
MIKFKFLFSALFLLAAVANAQEICDDGIDNDGDGFIDCFDPDCTGNSSCDGFYIGQDVTCEAIPNEFPSFSLTLDFASPNKTANHIGRIAVGDLDADGIPEIVAQNKYTDKLFILNGNDGSVKYETSVDSWLQPEWRVIIGNVEGDNCAEIYTILYDWTGIHEYYIVAYDCQLNELWRSEYRERDPVHMSLADFDGDGQVELFYKDEIRDARTGTRLVAGSHKSWNQMNGGPVAVDILGDGNLELVSGLNIYQVNLGSRTSDAGSLTLLDQRTEYNVKRPENATSIADYNQDGFLDVIATGKDDAGVTTVFFWDVKNDILRTYADPIPSVNANNLTCAASSGTDSYAKGWINGTGRLNIGDLDGDGNLNVSYVSGRFLYALDENFNLLWRVDVNEETSGYTGCTLFDFNGDGKTEVVYRDEQWLYIINGTDGSVFTQIRCISRTSIEYPIVADVDADGSTELCLVCGTSDVDAWDNFCNLSYSENSQVRVYKSGGEPWVPARRLWNQHGYFNVNVNDDLTIPAHQQKHHLVWSEGTCTQGPNRPLNNFLNQSPFLSSEGCPTYPSPDLTFVDNSLSITQPQCPELDFQVSFQMTNNGDVDITGNVPISFYNGDPRQAGAVKLATVSVTLNHFKIGEVATINETITGPGNDFQLFIVLSDNGTTVPTPISMPNTNFLECDYTNNILDGLVDPLPFALSAEKTDNIFCVGSSVPANGSANAYRLIGGVKNTTDYKFNWFNGTDATGTPDFTGPIYTGLSAGTYSVYATHKTAFCNSDTVQVQIVDVPEDFSVDVQIKNDNNNCIIPNGVLKAVITNGGSQNDYTYKWVTGSTGDPITLPAISVSHTATNLSSGDYRVLVTSKLSGCSRVAPGTVGDLTFKPVVAASAVDIICSNANSGEVSANVGGDVTGFTFAWYTGNNIKPTADFNGATITGLAQGDYTVVATNIDSKCKSDPVTVTVNQTTPPVIANTSSTDMNSCDPTLPNGSVTATFTGNASDYTIEWFAGQNTDASNLVGSTVTVNGLDQGTYTVRLTENSTGCSVTAEASVNSNIVIPNLSLTKTDVTLCQPFNGTITASVSTGSVSDYTFSWYNGNNVKATPDYSETGNTLIQLGAGTYTVEAFNNVTNCVASAKSVTVLAPVTEIQLDDAASSFPADCNATSGVLKVDVTPSSDLYNIDWYQGNVNPFTSTPFLTHTNVNTSTASNLTSGNYTVLATNIATGCQEVEVFYMPLATGHELDLITQASSTTCNDDNGTLEVELTPTNLVGFDQADYEIELYIGSSVASGTPDFVLAGVSGQSNYTFAGLASGDYAVTATPTNPAIAVCDDPVILVSIDMEVEYPDVAAITQNANTFCDDLGATPNGEIEVEIDGGASPANYIIDWFVGQDTSTPLSAINITGVNNERAINLAAGYYTVRVVDNTTYLTCSSTRTFQILNDRPNVSVPAAGLDITNVIRCIPSNGSQVIVTDIMEDGVSVGTANYTFEWYDASNNILPNAGAPNTTNQINDLAAGNYYVKAISTLSACQTTLIEFTIDDETISDPSVDLVSFQNPTKCLQPANLPGELHVSASGVGGGFSYSWTYPDGTIAAGPDQVGLTDAGEYTVVVTNTTTQCTTTEIYELLIDEYPVNLSTSVSPITTCNPGDDGVVFGVVMNAPNNYTYNWTAPAPDNSTFVGREWSGRSLEGTYSLTAVDNADPGCEASGTATITIEQDMPVVTAEAKGAVTVCDLTKADGSAIAMVDGSYIGYTFEWYDASGSPTPVYVGPEFFGMKPGTYEVVAIDNITKCSSTQQLTIEENITTMPDPTIEVLSHVTNCLTQDNGALSVSVNGNTSDYIFYWFVGQEVTADTAHIGEVWNNLTVSEYTVIAKSRITGCVSNPDTEAILGEFVYPEFEFVVGNASCSQENGFARFVLTNSVEIDSITWTYAGSDNIIAHGPNLSPAYAGIYTVTATTAQGCSISEDIEIRTEVNPYNGISRNGDSSNDYFRIDCIDQYPDNIVKIFNRAGTQVYEAEGYDNETTFFDGVSNKGISIIGTNLPDGTYFYVIDKRDGSKPTAGYLEIVN